MATKSTSSNFLGGNQSPEKIRQEFIEKPFFAARQTLISTSFEILDLMKLLPDVFIKSQQRELERLKATATENDARVSALEASISQATQLRTTIKRGEVRVQKIVSAVSDSEVSFQGFVSNAELQPLSGLTVRLSGIQTGRKSLSAKTDADGYFRIVLGAKPQPAKESKETDAEVDLEDRTNFSFRTFTEESERAASSSGSTARVEILLNEEVVFSDEVALALDQGGAYREYVVVVKESAGREANSEIDYKKVTDRKVSKTATAKKAVKKKRATSRPSKK